MSYSNLSIFCRVWLPGGQFWYCKALKAEVCQVWRHPVGGQEGREGVLFSEILAKIVNFEFNLKLF